MNKIINKIANRIKEESKKYLVNGKLDRKKVFMSIVSASLIASAFAVNASAVENTVEKINTALLSLKSKGTFVYDKDGDGTAEIVLDADDLKLLEGKVNSNDSILNSKIDSVDTSVTNKLTELNSSVETKIENINTTVNNTVTNKLKGALVPDESKGENGLVYDNTSGSYTLYLKSSEAGSGN